MDYSAAITQLGGSTLQNLDIKLLHSSMQTYADHRSRRRHVSHMTDERGETWSPSGMSKVRSYLRQRRRYTFCPCLFVCLSVSKITEKRVHGCQVW